MLAQRFPQLAAELGCLPERWWYCRPGKVNCALQQRFDLSEPVESVNVRGARIGRGPGHGREGGGGKSKRRACMHARMLCVA